MPPSLKKSLKVLALIEEGLIASEKVAKTLALAGTPVSVGGPMDTTLGPAVHHLHGLGTPEVSPVATLVAVALTTSPAVTETSVEKEKEACPRRSR